MVCKLIKFGIVGLFGLTIDFTLTYVFKEKLKFNKFFANALGFSTAVISNYYFNRQWTFKSINPQIIQQLGWFVIISLMGLGLNTIIIYLLNEKLGVCFYSSKFIAILIIFCWNFFLNNAVTFA